MRKTHPRQRSAFSLLEMILAILIAMLLLLALYWTLNAQVAQSQAARSVIAEGEVARSILARIANDISNQLGPCDPRGLPDYSGAAAAATTASSTTTGMASSSTTAPATTPAPVDTSNTVSYNFSIRGDSTSVTISGYRVQMLPFASQPIAASTSTDTFSDLRSVGIWLVDTVGLARSELRQATSQDLDTALTDLPGQNDLVFAKEVQNILFEYFDGTSWQTSWDGSVAAGEDGLSVVGPPGAIRVTLTMRKNNNASDPAYNEAGAIYQRIIALPASNSFPPPSSTP